MSERRSNIELLRVLSMLMIIFHHLAAHGVQHSLDADRYALWLSGSSINKAVVALAVPGGTVGVAIFFMISGYFQSYTSRINFRKIVRILLQTSFYGIFCILIYLVAKFAAGYPFAEISSGLFSFFGRALFIPATGGIWWFVSVYLYLQILAPLLNTAMDRLNQQGQAVLLLLAWFFLYAADSVFSGILFSLQKGIVFYLFGSFLRRNVKVDRIRSKRFYLLLLFGISWIAETVLWYFNTLDEYRHLTDAKHQIFTVLRSGLINSVTVVVCGLSILLFFLCTEIHSALINRLASATLGVYLLHENTVMRSLIWRGLLKVDSVQYHSVWFPLTSVISVIIVFIVCSLLESARMRLLEPPLSAGVRRYLDNIGQRFMI